jgi:hypothetical protein
MRSSRGTAQEILISFSGISLLSSSKVQVGGWEPTAVHVGNILHGHHYSPVKTFS